MIKYLLNHNKTFQSKLGTICIGFVFILIWSFTITPLLMGLTEYHLGQLSPPHSLLFFSTCMLTPLWEEALYRYGPITIAKNLGTEYLLPTIIMSSCLFGWGHTYDLNSVLMQGMMGLIFACVYIKNGFSLFSSVFLHGLWNFTVCFLI